MRRELNALDIDGTVVIGEGERDEAPMLYIGEEVGSKNGPAVDIALDPLEGTTLCAKCMPEEEMIRAEAATLACDLFIAIGSSLVVYPAAGFPIIAKQNGAKLVILNREETELDEIADLVLNTEAGPTLSSLLPHN